MIILLEGLLMCFLLLLVCVIGIANSPVNLAGLANRLVIYPLLAVLIACIITVI